jgi:TonB family protein
VFDPKNRIHWVGAIIIAIILILILGVASTASGQEPEDWSLPIDPAAQPEVCSQPGYAPREREPRLDNGSHLRQRMLDLQRSERSNSGGQVMLWVCVAASGHVHGVTIHTSSEDPILDSIAVRVGAEARFEPARDLGRPVSVWVAFPLAFVPLQEPVEL